MLRLSSSSSMQSYRSFLTNAQISPASGCFPLTPPPSNQDHTRLKPICLDLFPP